VERVGRLILVKSTVRHRIHRRMWWCTPGIQPSHFAPRSGVDASGPASGTIRNPDDDGAPGNPN
jgi:hypothetical protein